jgi:hypothetical protein
MEVLSPSSGDGMETVAVSCDLETSRCPPTVLVKEGAEQGLFARESQVRVRGSTRPAYAAIGRERGAEASVQSTRRDQGDKAYGLLRVP